MNNYHSTRYQHRPRCHWQIFRHQRESQRHMKQRFMEHERKACFGSIAWLYTLYCLLGLLCTASAFLDYRSTCRAPKHLPD